MRQGKEITIYDIAKKLNISAATVSRGLKDHSAISKATKKRILEAAKDMGYRFNSFASNLRTQRTNTIGVIVPRLNSHFMSEVIAGIEKVATQAGFNLIISQSLETVKKESENATTMFNSRVDGLLVSLAYDTKDLNHFDQFINRDIPVIFFDRVIEHTKCPNILIDNYKAGYEATNHLIEQGSRKIVHVCGSLLRNVYSERFRGFREALADHHLTFSEDQLIINNLNFQDGEVAAAKIISMKEKPDGVFVSNDTCAIGCILELKKHGIKIPDDIAFVGFNNDAMAKVVEPNLTTINYQGEEMGQLSARVLISHLNNQHNLTSAHTLLLRHELILRQSSIKMKK